MNIFFDIEESMSSEERDAFYQTKPGIALMQVKELIESRLSDVEQDFIWQGGAVLLYINNPSVLRIEFSGVNAWLTVKIKRGFRATDGDHIVGLIWRELHPGTNPPTIEGF